MKHTIMIFAAALCLMSCATGKRSALNDMRDLTQEISENAMTYNFKDWQKKQREFHKIDQRMQKHTYTPEEQHEINEMKGECLGYFAKGVLGKATNKITQTANQLQEIVDGIQKVLLP